MEKIKSTSYVFISELENVKDRLHQELLNKNDLSVYINEKEKLFLKFDRTIDHFTEGEVSDVIIVSGELLYEDGSELIETYPQYFTKDEAEQAFECLLERCKMRDPIRSYYGENRSLRHVQVAHSQKLYFGNHYSYLEDVLDSFWTKVVGKNLNESFCGGIITAHGDKCYSYMRENLKCGIQKEHTALLFLLSYSKGIYGDRPRHEVNDWIKEVYPSYKETIEEVEKEVLLQKYGVMK